MIIDVLFILLMVVAVYKGFNRGLIVAICSFFAILIGMAAALKLSTVVASWLHSRSGITAQWLPFISFILVMLAVILLLRIGASLLQKSVELLLMGWLNRLGGMLFYAAIYITLLSVVLFYAEKVHILKSETIIASKSYNFIAPWGPKIINGFGLIIPLFKNMFTELETFFSGIAHQTT
jgi:membrane protein required for colicin V production